MLGGAAMEVESEKDIGNKSAMPRLGICMEKAKGRPCHDNRYVLSTNEEKARQVSSPPTYNVQPKNINLNFGRFLPLSFYSKSKE
jgi:hypothetical protein